MKPVKDEAGMSSPDIQKYIRDVPDFPKKGIVFRDISPLLREHFGQAIASIAELLTTTDWEDIDIIGGIESRGFILAAGLAAVKHKGFVKIRKKGKLPGPVVTRRYHLEYGEDALEMQYGKGRMLIVDDVLATGGTLSTAAELAKESGHTVVGFVCLIDLSYLNRFAWDGMPAKSVVKYTK